MANRSTDSVRMVLFDRDAEGKFLILTETDDKDNWKLPGGSFDHEDEQPDVAAGRELDEELGLSSEDVNLVRVSELVNDDGISARYIYMGKVAGSAVKPSHEIHQTRWVTTSEVPDCKNHGHILAAVASASK